MKMSEVLEHLIARKDLSEEQAEQTLKVSQPHGCGAGWGMRA